jgi:hypothetical protein
MSDQNEILTQVLNTNNSSMSLSNLIINIINSDYVEIKYAEFDIIMCKKDQYLNMTKVVKLDLTKEGNPKEIEQWFRLEYVKELLNEIDSEVPCANRVPLFYSVKDGPNNLRGTYCHKLLVPHILSWCSPRFAVKVSKIVNMYYEHMGDIKTDELKILNDELIKLQNSTDQADKDFLAELECNEL